MNKFNRIVLILDGFDEAIMKDIYISDDIFRVLKFYEKYKSKVFLRIACRKGKWLNSFEEKLRNYWSDEEVQSYELDSLSDDDVKIALEHEFNNEDIQKFYSEVNQRELKHLLVKPITFKMLIDKYKKSHSLSITQNELYKESCEVLISEPTDEKKELKELMGVTTGERYRIAEYLAAMSILCGKNMIVLKAEEQGLNVNNITDNNKFLTLERINDTLETGLFRKIGTAYTWNHLTYAEYLAASYINRHFSMEQIKSLLTHSEGIRNRIIPQLHSLAGWLASMDTKIFDWIIETDLAVILLSDLVNIKDSKKKIIMEQYFEQEENMIYDYLTKRNIEQLKCDDTKNFIKNYLLLNEYEKTYKIYRATKVSKIYDIDYSIDEWKTLISIHSDMAFNLWINKKNMLSNPSLKRAILVNEYDKYEYSFICKSQHYLQQIVANMYPEYMGLEELILILINIENIYDHNKNNGINLLQYLNVEEIYKLISMYTYKFLEGKNINNAFKVYKNLIGRAKKLLPVTEFEKNITSSIEELLYAFKDNKVVIDIIINNIRELDLDWLQNKVNENIRGIIKNYRSIEMIEENKVPIKSKKLLLFNNNKAIEDKLNQLQLKDIGRIEEFFKELFKLDYKESFLRSIDTEFEYNRIVKLAKNKDIYESLTKYALIYIRQYDVDNYVKKKQDEVGIYCLYLLSYEGYILELDDKKDIVKKWICVFLNYELTNCNKIGVQLFKQFVAVDQVYVTTYIIDWYNKSGKDYDIIGLVMEISKCENNSCAMSIILKFIKEIPKDKNLLYMLVLNLLKDNDKNVEKYIEDRLNNNIVSGIEEDSIRDAYFLGCHLIKNNILEYYLADNKRRLNLINELLERTMSYGVYTMNFFSDFLRQLSANQIIEIYIWATNIKEQGYEVEHWHRFKENIILVIKDMDTTSSHQCIKEICMALPNDYEIQEHWSYIEKEFLENTWIPNSEEEIDQLSKSDLLLMNNGTNILKIIVKSIQEFNSDQNGLQLIKHLLWNDNDWSHKKETELSNLIAYYLNCKLHNMGIFVNREVQIKCNQKDIKGQIPDIVVQKKCENEPDVNIYVEVKGSWHKDARSAMEYQLINKYMKGKTRYGIYIVGWYGMDRIKKIDDKTYYNKYLLEYKNQAKSLSKKYNMLIEACILDISL